MRPIADDDITQTTSAKLVTLALSAYRLRSFRLQSTTEQTSLGNSIITNSNGIFDFRFTATAGIPCYSRLHTPRRQRLLRFNCQCRPHSHRIIHPRHSFGQSMGSSSRKHSPSLNSRGTSSRRSQYLEPRQPKGAILGSSHTSTSRQPRHRLRSPLELPPLPPTHVHHHQRLTALLRRRQMGRPMPRLARHALRPIREQDAVGRFLRLSLSFQSHPGGHSPWFDGI